VEARIQTKVSPREIRGEQSDTETGVSPSTSVSSVSIIPPSHHIHLLAFQYKRVINAIYSVLKIMYVTPYRLVQEILGLYNL